MVELPLYEHAWLCTCGEVNRGTFAKPEGRTEDGRYRVCDRCGFEIYEPGSDTNKLKAEGEFLLVPIGTPWRP